jgi:hypothetical protein
MAIPYSNKDILIATINGKKNAVIVINSDKGLVSLVNKNRFIAKDSARFNIEQSNVIANLGKAPKLGSVYGTPVEPVLAHDNSELFGNIFYYVSLDEKTRSKLIKKLTNIGNNLKELDIFPSKKFDILIKPSVGNIAGWYKHFKKKEKIDELCLCLETYDHNLEYYIYHEIAHAVWYNNVSDEFKARWVKAYHDNISQNKVNDNKLTVMRQDLVKAGSIASYRSDIDEEDKEILKKILQYVKQNHRLAAKHINILIATGDSLVDIWPEYSIEIPMQNVLVTDYSNKSVEELFAESFAFYFVEGEVELPKKLKKLMKATIAATGANEENEG